jgi:hypothetical protein
MWVVNQDGIAVVQVDGLALDPVEIANNKIVRVWGSTADHDYVMGTYGSIQEAIEVLDDFKSAVVKGQKVFTCPKAKKVEENTCES